jgi:hypothetical protein
VILRIVSFTVRCLCELAALLLITGLLTLVLAVRLTRRLVVDRPGRLDKILELGIPPTLVAGILLWLRVSGARQGQSVDSIREEDE